MYHQHFSLNRSPFSIEPDPDFLWLGEKHQEGLSVLRYGILENKGFLLLTGDIGTGKTVLIRSLLAGLPGDVTAATIQDPSLTLLDFFNILSHELGMASTIDGKADFLVKFKKFVRHVYASQKSLLVIIDEAQRLTHELLDEIRVLSNIDFDNRKLINIFFVGQIEFNQILTDPCNIALRQRISVSYHLVPLNHEETDAYIRHRLKVAGTEKELFIPEAVHEIFKFSNGTPRLINILCDRALITGFSRDLNSVSPEMIRECAKELDISSGAEAADFKSIPQIETPPAIQETADQAKAFINPFRIRRKWIAASVVSAAAFLLFGVFFTNSPENNRAQKPASTERQSFEILQAIKADPKDSSKSIESKERHFLFFFKPSSADLEDGSYEILRQVMDLLSANPNSEVTLTTRSTKDDSPGFNTKLLGLRATSIKSVLASQPKFKGTITVIDSYAQGTVESQKLADTRFSKPWAEIRVEPGAKSRVFH